VNLILFRQTELGRPLPKTDPRAVHLVKVLRKKPGDSFDAGVLDLGLGRGIVERADPDGSLHLGIEILQPVPERLPLHVAVGFPRPIQLRRLLRDLSSLGVRAVDLVGSDLGEKSYRDTNLLSDGGAEAALIEGAAQSRDASLPALEVFAGLDRWLAARLPAGDSLLIAADNVSPEAGLAELPGGKSRALLAVGPERGWSQRERSLFAASGFRRLSAGSRALRTETACIACAILTLEKIGALR